MQRLRVIGPSANFHAGVLDLTPDQAAARAHALESLGDNLYLIKAPVQFKTGEELGFDGDTNKALLQATETTETPAETKPARKPKVPAETKPAPAETTEDK